MSGRLKNEAYNEWLFAQAGGIGMELPEPPIRFGRQLPATVLWLADQWEEMRNFIVTAGVIGSTPEDARRWLETLDERPGPVERTQEFTRCPVTECEEPADHVRHTGKEL